MKALEKQAKFNEFRKLTQDGNLSSVLIAKQLGITLNTVYNWRKKLRLEKQSAQPSFSRVVVSPGPEQACPSFVEIVIGNNIVFRIPDQSSRITLQTILDNISHWGFER
jgi:hypothetical protein